MIRMTDVIFSETKNLLRIIQTTSRKIASGRAEACPIETGTLSPFGALSHVEMPIRSPHRRRTSCWLAPLAMLILASAPANAFPYGSLPTQPQQGSPAQASPERGRQLFAGQIPFQNGGPACTACHGIAGLSFPNGGTLGPNLTKAYRKLGPEGMDAALETLYFPTMFPLYDPHPLTIAEQSDVKAFLQQAASQSPNRDITWLAAIIALFGFVVLVLITRTVWRNRLMSVRRTFVERAMRRGAFPS